MRSWFFQATRLQYHLSRLVGTRQLLEPGSSRHMFLDQGTLQGVCSSEPQLSSQAQESLPVPGRQTQVDPPVQLGRRIGCRTNPRGFCRHRFRRLQGDPKVNLRRSLPPQRIQYPSVVENSDDHCSLVGSYLCTVVHPFLISA